ncbi:hypothetical protein SteCoe_6784 [Stentor coeruleus]|uniref:Uncharacterized protein n=1 Tax=Stentor coeruleus TaxID=5963 RepID=A0A1R2CP94_9CILI|nr:hypothetical protein SteCoe_6784 [Stentor coeruleus]
MQGINGKHLIYSSPTEKNELNHQIQSFLKSRSSSTRNLSPKNSVNKGRKHKNLSLMRTPSANCPKKTPKHLLFSSKNNKRLRSLSIYLNNKLKLANQDNHSEYLQACRSALKELIEIKHPISTVLESIQKGYEAELSSKSTQEKNSSSKFGEIKILRNKNLKNSFSKGSLSTGSTLDRLKFRRGSGKKPIKLRLLELSQEKSSPTSVPKLNIKKITIAKQEFSEKITNTREETMKNYYFQDYQDEFMSKFEEFSESWRRQILEKRKHLH